MNNDGAGVNSYDRGAVVSSSHSHSKLLLAVGEGRCG
jgi:hypothetical protein